MFDCEKLKTLLKEACDPEGCTEEECHTENGDCSDCYYRKVIAALREMGDRVEPLTRYEQDGVQLFISDEVMV